MCCQFGIFVSKREARGMIKTGTAEGVGLKAEVGFGRTEDWTANEKVDQHTRLLKLVNLSTVCFLLLSISYEDQSHGGPLSMLVLR